ncbi:unnamed protein product, partial [Brenthis ino]
MSKRNSIASNTLFNYFTKTPPSNKKPKQNSGENKDKLNNPVNKDDVKPESKKRERKSTPSPKVNTSCNNDSDEEVPISIKKRKRIRLNPIDSDDSDVENKDNKIEKENGSVQKDKISIEKKLQESFSYEPGKSPVGSKLKKVTLNDSQIKAEPQESLASDEGNWNHCKLDWLKPDKIKDSKGRRPDHPDYDPTTLYVPPDFMKKQTPGHKQWWEIKSQHFDCVLFFKVGKFYELYHMDASVGVNELGFSYMKGDFAHSGFPESAYSRMATTLISKGYKVVRVEQTETPDMMQERCKKSGQSSKVVRREVCQVSVRGARAPGLQDAGAALAAAEYMLAIAEEENNGCSTFGVCFIDTTIGHFHMGQFDDDKHSSRLLTTLAHYPPALIIYERKTTSTRTSKLLSTHCHSARLESMPLSAPDKTLKLLAEKYYRTNDDGDWPEGLKPFLYEGDALGLTPAKNSHLTIKALGGCIAYLTKCLLDIQILGMSQFSEYSPPDVLNSTLKQEDMVDNGWTGGNTMVLDAITLRNLRIVQDEGCLYDKLNFCSTPMGKRLLYQWVCSPSCDLALIKERQQAVKALYENQELSQDVKNLLATLPDLERLLAKIHALGNSKKAKDHPDSRAIFYEEKTYSKRKVLDFISVLNGFTSVLKLSELFSNEEAVLLRSITQFGPEGRFPDYRDTLKFFKEAFNQQEAEKEGRILPGAGVDQEYDTILEEIKQIEQELKNYLTQQEKYFKCRITYVGTDKKRYQLEVPQSAAAKAGPQYHMEGTRKGFKRYSTDETKDFLARMIAAEEHKTNVLKDLSRRIFEKFSTNYNEWEMAVKCIATLDILLSFAEFARQQIGDVCLPEVTFEKGQEPYVDITGGRHPCMPQAEFIPNDVRLRGARLLLLTGPNMGGKSTLMRQLGLLTVLAHLGSYVPARACALSACARVFTRLGARDDVLAARSTFLLEMQETAAVLRHATPHALVLLDELGRGTSTYDGTALAAGVAAALAARGARTLLSTHYHALVHAFRDDPRVLLGHMACMVETDEASADTDEVPEETITFLYKLSAGACPKSYGFNAARLAGVPRDVTARARRVARALERDAREARARRDAAALVRCRRADDMRALLAGLTI